MDARHALLVALMLAGCGDGRPSAPPMVAFDAMVDANVDEGMHADDARMRSDAATMSDAMTDATGGGPIACLEGARWVYLLGSDGDLVRFRPDEMRFELIARLRCPTSSLSAAPFSMSIDRGARAWVSYSNGELFVVNTGDGSCMPTTFTSSGDVFGMGFVAESEGSDREQLFIAGGNMTAVIFGTPARLGTLDTTTLRIAPLGSLTGWPDLAGTGAGQLWGFFPLNDPPLVLGLDKTDGHTLQTFDISGIVDDLPLAWAFSLWDGKFYLFLRTLSEERSRLYRLDPDVGTPEMLMMDVGYSIVGAGVSTCAPFELI